MKKYLSALFAIVLIVTMFSGCSQLKNLFGGNNADPISSTDAANPSSSQETTKDSEQESKEKETVAPLVPATKEQPTETTVPTTEKPTEPSTEEPTTEEPTTEEPTTEEPTTEEPTTIPPYSGPESVHAMALEVIRGRWANGRERRRLLEEAGYNYAEIQAEVNRILGYTEQPIDLN